jgi:sugar (pentulose or hexulose) kinase
VSRTQVSCGVDLGSSNIKVVAVLTDGTVVARRSRPSPRRDNHPTIDAEQLLGVVEDMLIDLVGENWVIAAVCVAGVGEDGVPVAADGRAISEALAWFDPRRADAYDQLPAAVRMAAVRSVTGVQLDPSRTLVAWSRLKSSDQPEWAAWMALTDYPASRWTGRFFMSDTLASRTAAWNPRTRAWLQDVVTATLGDPSLLGPVLPAGEILGPLASAALNEEKVLAPGAVVVVGGHDHPIAASLVERMRPGAVLDSMGTAEVVVRSATELGAALTEVDESVSVSAGLGGRGATLLAVAELARNILWAMRSGEAIKQAMDGLLRGTIELAAISNPQELFVQGEPAGHPPVWTQAGRQASPVERASAALTACAFNSWHMIEMVKSETDAPVFATGGWTRSPGWIAARRSLDRRPLELLPEPEVTAVDAALIAGAALGWSQNASHALGY